MNVDRILALANLIESQPHVDWEATEGFNMSVYHHPCGTPSCISGWAGMLGRKKGDIFFGETAANSYLDIDQSLGSALYRPGPPKRFQSLDEPECAYWSLITPAMAAKTLRILAETGRVDWSHTGLENTA